MLEMKQSYQKTLVTLGCSYRNVILFARFVCNDVRYLKRCMLMMAFPQVKSVYLFAIDSIASSVLLLYSLDEES